MLNGSSWECQVALRGNVKWQSVTTVCYIIHVYQHYSVWQFVNMRRGSWWLLRAVKLQVVGPYEIRIYVSYVYICTCTYTYIHVWYIYTYFVWAYDLELHGTSYICITTLICSCSWRCREWRCVNMGCSSWIFQRGSPWLLCMVSMKYM